MSPPVTRRATLRERLEAEIDRLIDMLDALDGDADLEDGADTEPSMGWPIPTGGLGRSAEPLGWDCDPRVGDVEDGA